MMLFIPSGDDVLRILAIDPGTSTLGTAILDVDLRDFSVTVVDAATYAASTHLKNFPQYAHIEEIHGSRAARLLAHRNNLLSHLHAWKPHQVACESPFMGIRPQAFEALVDCLNTVRQCVYEYYPLMRLDLVPPHSAKKAVGVIGRETDKDDMRRAVEGMLRDPSKFSLYYRARQPLYCIDEHTIDAIAVGYFHYRMLIASL